MTMGHLGTNELLDIRTSSDNGTFGHQGTNGLLDIRQPSGNGISELVVVDCFYIALFSALKQSPCTCM